MGTGAKTAGIAAVVDGMVESVTAEAVWAFEADVVEVAVLVWPAGGAGVEVAIV